MDNNRWLDNGLEDILQDPEYANRKFKVVKNALPQKMSAVLLDFAKPLLIEIDLKDRDAVTAVIEVAITIWNYSIIIDKMCPPDEVSDGFKKSYIEMAKKCFHGEFGEMVLDTLFARKQSLYPENQMHIVDFSIIWDEVGGEFHLTVISGEFSF